MPRLQLNLLPDIKLEANKQERSRNRLISIAVLVGAACFAIFLLMALTVYGVQKKQLSDSNNRIQTATDNLNQVPDLKKVLTVRNQLSQLTTLHQSKHTTSRLFDYLTKLTPKNVSINQVSLDTSTSSIRLSGTADSPHAVNVFIDTIKYTGFKMGDKGAVQVAFSGVVENSFGLSQDGVTFNLNFKFNPLLFAGYQIDSQGNVITPVLVVPNKNTSRSSITDNLFTGQAKETK